VRELPAAKLQPHVKSGHRKGSGWCLLYLRKRTSELGLLRSVHQLWQLGDIHRKSGAP